MSRPWRQRKQAEPSAWASRKSAERHERPGHVAGLDGSDDIPERAFDRFDRERSAGSTTNGELHLRGTACQIALERQDRPIEVRRVVDERAMSA
jgi:hypothetical protein